MRRMIEMGMGELDNSAVLGVIEEMARYAIARSGLRTGDLGRSSVEAH